jgi:vitamin B12 transporter
MTFYQTNYFFLAHSHQSNNIAFKVAYVTYMKVCQISEFHFRSPSALKTSSYFIVFMIAFVATNYKLNSQIDIDTISVVEHSFFHRHTMDLESVTDPEDASSGGIQKLSRLSSIQYQAQSPGGLHTILHRGMGSRHFAILWEGINLQNIHNGTTDLNLFPFYIFNEAGLSQFGASPVYGANATGAALLLNVDSQFRNGIFTSYSHVGNLTAGVRSGVESKNMKHFFGAEYRNDQNKFSYKIWDQYFKRESSAFESMNLYYLNHWYIHKNSVMESSVWYQKSEREVPVSLTTAPIDQNQTDENFRFVVRNKTITGPYRWETQISFLDENTVFLTPVINSIGRTKTYLVHSSIEYLKSNMRSLGIRWRRDVSLANFFNKNHYRNTFSLNTGIQQKIAGSIAELDVRADLVDDRLRPISAQLHWSRGWGDVKLARNYQLPTFNDLFWTPGGNSELKSELVHKAELSGNYSIKNQKFRLIGYAIFVDDWVQWLPTSTGFWEANNQQLVFSRGLELVWEKQYKYKDLELNFSVACAQNQTTILKHYNRPELIGKQLIFIPQSKINASVDTNWKKHQLNNVFTWVGTRYQNPDNSVVLPAYHFFDISYQYQFSRLNLGFQLSNMLNHQFSIIPFFPMPLRIYTLNAEFLF